MFVERYMSTMAEEKKVIKTIIRSTDKRKLILMKKKKTILEAQKKSYKIGPSFFPRLEGPVIAQIPAISST